MTSRKLHLELKWRTRAFLEFELNFVEMYDSFSTMSIYDSE